MTSYFIQNNLHLFFCVLTILTELCSSAAFQGQSRAVIVTPAPLKREGILTPATSQSNVAIAPAGIVRVRRRKKQLRICFLGLLFASSESHNVFRQVMSPLLMCYPTYAFVHSELCLLIFNVATSWAWKHFIVLTGSVSHNSKVPRRPVFTVLRMGMVCALTVQKLEGAHLSTAILENVPWVCEWVSPACCVQEDGDGF